MEIGKRYIVTKGSDDGTFEVGDHIIRQVGGSILCVDARGWIDAEYVYEATQGMEIEVDQEWIERRRKQLLKELETLDGTSMV